MTPVHQHLTILRITLLAALMCMGCRPTEQIQTYDIPKPPEKQRPDRMLGAVAFHGDTAWFFKATGSRLVADSLEPAFKQFVESVNFDESSGEPNWSLPEGWVKSDKVVQLRHATLTAPAADTKIDVTVSQLPWPGGDEDQFVLSNYNRWRGQLGERPALMIELFRDVDKLELANGAEATYVRLDGKQKSSGPSGMGMPAGHPPVASGPSAGPAGPGEGPERPGAPGASGGVKYETPEGWQPGRTGGMRKAAFEIGDGNKTALVTVIDLPGQSGSFADNVNRWRGQVLLQPEDAKKIAADAKAVDMGGVEGRYVELVGEKETILGVIAPSGGKTWFIKLRGDNALSAAEKQRFEQFIRSLRLP